MNKCNTKDKWNRLNESKFTKSFALTSTIQAIVLIFLQSRIFVRNVNGWVHLHSESNEHVTDTNICLDPTSLKEFVLLAFENITFICFYLFQLYFCLNAIFHQNMMQVFTIAITNFCYAILGVVQFIETKETSVRIFNDCPTIVLDPELMMHEVPHIILTTILACIMGYLSFKLYKQFGWNVYKRIGTDVQMQSIYRTRLIFLMLLKLDLLMMLLFSILIIPYYIVEFNSSGIPYSGIIYMGITFFALVFLFESIAYQSIVKEVKSGMMAFLLFWVLVMGNYGWFCYVGFSLAFTYHWYIGSIFGISCLLIGASTFIVGIMVTRNFGKGLKEHLDKLGKKNEEFEKHDVEIGSEI